MYYQPVIFDTDRSDVNGIGLYRNNSIAVNVKYDDEYSYGGHYYAPDYLLKIESINDENQCKYFIIDAKFSNIETVSKYYIKDLAFKYLFSISTLGNHDKIMGMCIMYGKCNYGEKLCSVYNNQVPDTTIYPLAETFPIIAGIDNEDQYNKFDNLIKLILN